MSQFSHELISNFTLLWILFGLIIFVILLFIRAPYGKHYNTKWGPEQTTNWVDCDGNACSFDLSNNLLINC